MGTAIPALAEGQKAIAFPGAEGFGRYATGGRGGKVYHVTTLQDGMQEGTLRHAVMQEGPRTVVFDVAGTIFLEKELRITHSDLTLAGQSAPGQGVCIADYPVVLKADNLIIRYLHFRVGNRHGGEPDGLGGTENKNVIIDHCSISWSVDECCTLYGGENLTVQWCMVTESLRTAGHGKGRHGYGAIFGGARASYHHNLLAHHESRVPRLGPRVSTQEREYVDMRNNVMYNWAGNGCYGGEGMKVNIVNNYYKPGPASKERNYFIDAYWYNSSSNVGSAYPRLYMSGNYHAGGYASAINGDNWLGVYYHPQGDDPSKTAGRLSAPLSVRAGDTQVCHTTTHSAADAFDAVLKYAGASLSRDAVDKRAESDARSGEATFPNGGNGSTGGIIDTQSAVGGWPELTATDEEIRRAATDTDGDGIPDYYETLLGLDPNDASDANATTLDPQGIYPNIEVYFHFLVREISAAQTAGGTYTALE